MSDFALESECSVCGDSHTPDAEGWAICYGSDFESGPHIRTVVWRPCKMCGRAIDYLELCGSCAEDNDPFPKVDPMHARPVRPRGGR